jgi:hypothetical protein
MARRGFLARLADAVSGFFGRRDQPEQPYEQAPQQPPLPAQPPEPAGYEPLPEPSGYQQEPQETDYGYTGPTNEYGYPAEQPTFTGPYEPDGSFEGLSSIYDLQPGSDAYDALYAGWYDPELDFVDRMFARQEFFDLMGMDAEEFDWDDWRDWYSATAA